MYPDYPEKPADLVPLPRCDGPKLEPFDFQGPQEIEFLEYLGEGAHSHVVKVRIRSEIYALKLVSGLYLWREWKRERGGRDEKKKGTEQLLNKAEKAAFSNGELWATWTNYLTSPRLRSFDSSTTIGCQLPVAPIPTVIWSP